MSDLKKKITDGFKLVTDLLEALSKKYEASNPGSSGAALFDATIAGLKKAEADIIKDFATPSAAAAELIAEPDDGIHQHLTELVATVKAKTKPPAKGTPWEKFFVESWPSINDAFGLAMDFLDGPSKGEKVAYIVLDTLQATGQELSKDLSSPKKPGTKPLSV